MKKSVAAILALVVLMTAVLFGCGKKEEDNTPDTQTTVSNENTTSAEEPTTQQSLAEKYPSQTSPDGSEEATSASSEAETTEKKPEQQETTKESSSVQSSTSPSLPSEKEDEDTSSPTTSAPSQSNNGAYRIANCQKIFEAGTYKMTMYMDDSESGEPMPAKISVMNGNVYMGMEMDGLSAGMLYRADNDKCYMIIDIFNAYTDVSEDMMGEDFDLSEFTEQFKVNVSGEISVEKATFEGKPVTCESYADGKMRVKYYFDSKDNFVGTEKINSDGKVNKLVVEDFGTDVDPSVFEIPKGYIYLPLSSLM